MMKNFLSNKIINIKPSGIRKFFDIVMEMDDVLSLGVGEPDFDTPWHIRDEGIYAFEKGKTFYTSNTGLKELRIEICKYLKRKYNLNYDPLNEVIVTVGGSEAIDIGLRAIINEGDEVIIPQPCYVSYAPCATLTGAVCKYINLKEENNFKLTKEELLNSITDKTKILILPFPNNPTGAILEEKDMFELSKVIIDKNILVMTDEIYSELTYTKKHMSIASIDGMKERTIYINGFSKSFAMTGWRLGYVCAPKVLIEQMLKIHQFAIMCAPTISQYAAIDALKNSDEDVQMMKDAYDERRKFLLKSFKEMNLKCFEPFGAFYVFPSIKEFGMTSEEFALKLLETEKIAVVPGSAFGDSGEGFIRISYAYSLDNLKIAIKRINNFVMRLRNEN